MKGCDIVTTGFIVPTGRIIKDYLDENNITQKELCTRIGMSEKHISNLLNGNSRLTEEFALKLEKVLVGVPASYWLNYEVKYREFLARNLEKFKLNQTNLKEMAKKFKFSEVFKGLNLTLVEQAIEMLKLLKISDFNNFDAAYSNLSVNFMEDGGEKEAIAIWLNLCESEIEIQNADNVSSIKYEKTKLEKSLHLFKKLAYNDNIEFSIKSCRRLCNKLGIYLVLCEAVVNSKVRGALTTYKGNPVIYLSGRFKSHDHIWFAFLHELGHLLKHYNKKDTIISLENENEDIENDLREEEANEFARNFLIDPEDYKVFISQNEFTSESIRKFAKKQNVLPGIVVARLQHDRIIKYDKFTSLKQYI
ncbi:MAG: ImmA/IrrE family metallo-endopeptidase [Clostridium sp.]|jgi:plasmid maintenance system antidote protein VapI/Zn-dependent peptidase ImmA (M78 family)|nr:ImmA/IrrE family metallo-endopeptidase [Clostridium sp.]